MKKNTRLLIRLTLADGGMQSYGYDAWYRPHQTLQGLLRSVEDNFATIPEHAEAHLFYDTQEREIGHIESWEELREEIADFMGYF